MFDCTEVAYPHIKSVRLAFHLESIHVWARMGRIYQNHSEMSGLVPSIRMSFYYVIKTTSEMDRSRLLSSRRPAVWF